MNHVHIDADVLAYETAFGAQKTQYHLHWAGETTSFRDSESCQTYCKAKELDYRALRKAEPDTGAYIATSLEVLPEGVCDNILREKVGRIFQTTGASSYTLHLSGSTNYRTTVAVTKPYKGNRDQPKPIHFAYVQALLRNHPRIKISDGCEADDNMAIDCGEGDIIATIDKDLNQVPGRHYDWNKGIRYTVSRELGLWYFLRQMLLGDATDNIPGVPGLGEKKADALLDPYRADPEGAWREVIRQYNMGPFKFKDGTITAYPGDYLTEMGKLLWMQRQVGEQWSPELFEDKYLTVT